MSSRFVCIPCDGPMNQGAPLDYSEAPLVTAQDYEARAQALLAAGEGYTHLVVYADKEHFSNLEYLTGYDPRYEECLYLLTRDRLPQMVLGNEGMGQAQCVTVPHEKVLCQLFSPMGQPRGTGTPLAEILKNFGIGPQSKVGVLGWKGFTALDDPGFRTMFEVPSFLVDTLRSMGCQLENANWLMMDNAAGLRAVHDVKELVLSELASAKASRKVWDFIRGLEPGMTELDASQLMNIDGEPCPTYPNICFRGKGILSPTPQTKLEQGAAIAFGMGYRCAQIHRMGFYVKDRAELDTRYPGVYEGLLKPYFEAVCTWFESLAIGATGGQVWEAVRQVIGSYQTFGIVLNPGHLIHTEEWMNTPFSQGDTTPLRSGMMIQCDFTARPAALGGVGSHIEDGVILADQETREAIRAMAPKCFERMMARQRFMREVLGIQLHDEVLPTSDLCGMLHPFLADPTLVMAKTTD